MRFLSQADQQGCTYSNSSGALTWTTSSIPVVDHCFNLTDLLSGNATTGFVNQTSNLAANAITTQPAGISWTILNRGSYDPAANYSSILYRQDSEAEAGAAGNVKVTVYGFADCNDEDPSGNPSTSSADPWYGFSCLSGPEGSCGSLPYGVASFSVGPGDDQGKCWVFAKEGGAAVSTPMSVLSFATILATVSWLMA